MTPLPETLLRARARGRLTGRGVIRRHRATEHECYLATKVDHITAANPTGALHL